MLKIATCLILASALVLSQTSHATPNLSASTPPAFEENKGQLADQFHHQRNDILFYGNAGGMAYYLKTNGISYQLFKTEGEEKEQPLKDKLSPVKDNSTTTIYRIDISWQGANVQPVIVNEGMHEDNNNYYLAHCPDGITNVKSYSGITYQGLYDGIDLKYYHKEGSLKYDYIVNPGADYKSIQLKIEGATSIAKKADGSIVINTPLGDITEAAPLVLQDGREIASAWVMHENVLSFDIADYDRSKPLIIDPITRQWGTYIGSADFGTLTSFGLKTHSCVIDNADNVYMATVTASATGVATSGAYQTVFAGVKDAFIIKFNSAGVRQWATYYGGAAADYANNCAIDNNGYLYVAGSTLSTSGIASSGAHQTTFGGGTNKYDAFLVKFNTSGQRIWSTYYGANMDDFGSGCAVDIKGNVYFTGYAFSSSGISTTGAHQPTIAGGYSDAFLVKFNGAGVRQWGTYYGGLISEMATDCIVDNGFVYFTGNTNSSSGIATPGAYQTVVSTYPDNDAFLAKFDTNGVRQWGTYYGGLGLDIAYGTAIDNNHNVYMCGSTLSTSAMGSSGAYQPGIATNVNGNETDAFLVKFNSSGTRQWGTYYGGPNTEAAHTCVADRIGHVYLSGVTNSTTGISTTGAYQQTFQALKDGFIAVLDTNGVRESATYYGTANGADGVYGSAVGSWNNLYVCGSTSASTTEMASPGAHQTIGSSAFLAKFTSCYTPFSVSASAVGISRFCKGDSVKLVTPANANYTYQWIFNGTPIDGANDTMIAAKKMGAYTVAVSNGECVTNSVPITVNAVDIVNNISTTNALCNSPKKGSITLTSSAGVSPYHYAWSALPDTTATVINLTGGDYIVTTTDSIGCSRKDTINILTGIDVLFTTTNNACFGDSTGITTASVTGGTPPYTYQWKNSSTVIGTTATITNLKSRDYYLQVKDVKACIKKDTVHILQPHQALGSICAVTVDSATGKNLIIWEKAGIENAKTYKVYREAAVSGTYALVDSVASNIFSTILDISSVPLQQSYSYKMSVVDSCNNESPLSIFHKTIHLNSNQGINNEINLAWNIYEGTIYSTHYIMRSNNGGGYIQIAQVPSTTTAYTDLTPPTGLKEYRIDIDLATSCSPSAKVTSYQKVSSNSVSWGTNGIGAVNKNGNTRIIPNPATGIINIIGEKPATIIITDALGKIVMEAHHAAQLSLGDVPAGMYMVRLYNKDNIAYYYQKLVKE